MVFITKGISIIFVRLILKNLRKCTHKTDTVYLEFERNSLVFEVNFDANYCQNIGVLLQREVGTNVCEDAINIYKCLKSDKTRKYIIKNELIYFH